MHCSVDSCGTVYFYIVDVLVQSKPDSVGNFALGALYLMIIILCIVKATSSYGGDMEVELIAEIWNSCCHPGSSVVGLMHQLFKSIADCGKLCKSFLRGTMQMQYAHVK